MKINELYGESWINAIYEVMDKLNVSMDFDSNLFMARDKYRVEKLAYELKLEFNENGHLIYEK